MNGNKNSLPTCAFPVVAGARTRHGIALGALLFQLSGRACGTRSRCTAMQQSYSAAIVSRLDGVWSSTIFFFNASQVVLTSSVMTEQDSMALKMR